MSETALATSAVLLHNKGAATKASGGISAVVSHPDPCSASRHVRVEKEKKDTNCSSSGFDDRDGSEPAIREQLAGMLQSSVFVQSERLSRFLRFIVEHALNGNQDYLKEYVIGSEVYDRKPPYHPSQDSIVRTEARRLRGKLAEYYEGEGKEDLVYIYLRPGSYIPVFQYKDALAGALGLHADDPLAAAKESAIAIAILPFSDVSAGPRSTALARGIPDELAFRLMRIEGCRVMAPASASLYSTHEPDLAKAMSKLGAQIAFEGSVREEANHIRITARIVDTAGVQLWVKRFEIEADGRTSFAMEEQIASALIRRIVLLQSMVKRQHSCSASSNLEFCAAVLGAEELLNDGAAEDVQSALVRFEELVLLQPGDPHSLCGLAQCYCRLPQLTLHSGDLLLRAREASCRAMELEPRMAAAHSAMASVLALEWRWEEAEHHFIQALSLHADNRTLLQYADLLILLGRFDEAWLHLQEARNVDPFYACHSASVARFFYYSRRYDEALQWFSQPFSQGPQPLEILAYLALIHAQLGHCDDAKQMAEQIRNDAEMLSPLKFKAAEILAGCGELASASLIVRDLNIYKATAPVSNARRASLSLAMGDPIASMALLSTALDERDSNLPWVLMDPRFDAFRENPQFRQLKAAFFTSEANGRPEIREAAVKSQHPHACTASRVRRNEQREQHYRQR